MLNHSQTNSSSPPIYTGTGAGKVVLLGEHSVVYGKPAIATSINRGAYARLSETSRTPSLSIETSVGSHERLQTSLDRDDLLSLAFKSLLQRFSIENPVDISVTLDLPIKSGMGSSAAIATALARACAHYTDAPLQWVDDAVRDFERLFHGSPSGIDQAAASGLGVFLFQPNRLKKSLDVNELPIVVCVADEPSSTYHEVSRVAKLHARNPDFFAGIDSLVGSLVEEGAQALQKHDFEAFGHLMCLNHGLLYTLGCSTPSIERARHIALEAGAVGSKVTGAGGGGCVIAMARNLKLRDQIVEAWADDGYLTFSANVKKWSHNEALPHV